jgi:cell division protein FtsL
MRSVIGILLIPIAACSLIMIFTSTGLALAIYLLSLAVAALSYATLYLQRDLEQQLLGEIDELHQEIKKIDNDVQDQKEQLVEFKRQVIELDSRYDERLTAIEEQTAESAVPRSGYRKAAPVLMMLLLGLVILGVLYPTESLQNLSSTLDPGLQLKKMLVQPKTDKNPAKSYGPNGDPQDPIGISI